MRLSRIITCLLLVSFLSPSFGQDQKRLQLMQKEKERIRKVRVELARKGASPLLIFQQVYVTIARGNQKQYASNKKLVGQLRQYAAIAEKKRLPKKRDAYLKLAAIYKYYAEQNEHVVKAYQECDSAKMAEALGEIDKIEQKITAMGFKPAKRDWFTIKELNSVPLPGQEPKQPTDSPDSTDSGSKNS
jgi:valyl-tRNA synthetase